MRREKLLMMLLALASVAPFLIVMLHLTIIPDDLKQPSLYGAGSGDTSRSGSGSEDATNSQQAHVKGTIAYAISLTGCSTHGSTSATLLQGAAVLGHSIHRNSAANPGSGSRYGYKLFAFVHPDALPCSADLSAVGYELLIRETPVNVTDIRGQYLRENVHLRGCCGEKEFLKLYAYQLIEYPVAVHLDADCLVLRPLDDLFDAMLDGPGSPSRGNVSVMHGAELPERIDAFFTRDYNMVHPGHKHPGFQGGFLVVRPSLQVFEEYRQLILEGSFVQGAGWNGTYGGYWGAMQIQGLCSYFYDGLHPGTGVELNRCIYNQMVDNPRKEVGKTKEKRCTDGREECEDCRKRDASDIFTVHFTQECGKPWDCSVSNPGLEKSRLCQILHREWFSVRKDWEGTNSITVPSIADGLYWQNITLGYCRKRGHYMPFKLKGNR